MTDVQAPSVARTPTMDRAAFECPHCLAFTQQAWAKAYIVGLGVDKVPNTPNRAKLEQVVDESPEEQRAGLQSYIDLMLQDYPAYTKEDHYCTTRLANVYLSTCFICKRRAIWLKDRMIWPAPRIGITPNPDLPPHILADFNEALEIAAASPRGAAALLRLAIEKLCIHLKKVGTIDAMIGQLVADGLSVQVQQALDVVRVVGNDAVHPGTMDFGDDPATVQTLFRLVNVIAEKTITEERHVAEAFADLPPEKREWIENRNRGARRKAEPPAA